MQHIGVFKFPKCLAMDLSHMSFNETFTVFKSETRIAILLILKKINNIILLITI